jgi:histidinol-phosphatase
VTRTSLESDLALAQRAALTGAELALRYFQDVHRLPKETKPDGSIVTEADRAVEEALRGVLLAERPTDAFLGEETGEQAGAETGERSRASRRRWIVDPIDGTALFAEGDDRWLVLVALEEDEQLVVGVAATPAQGEVWWARRGGGAHVADIDGLTPARERRIFVNASPPSLAQSRLGVVPWADPLLPADRAIIERLSTVVTPRPWRTHPALLVASGRLDLAVQLRGQVWDFAATSLIVEEAGGRFTGVVDQGHLVTGAALFASSPDLQDAALEHLR